MAVAAKAEPATDARMCPECGSEIRIPMNSPKTTAATINGFVFRSNAVTHKAQSTSVGPCHS